MRLLAFAAVAFALAIGAIGGAVLVCVAGTSIGSLDFVALYAAARLVLLGRGAAVVDQAAILEMEHVVAPDRVALLPFVHPPVVAVILAPLAALPLAAAYAVMVAIGTGALVAAALLLAPLARTGQRRVLLAFAVLAPSSTVALAQGQTSPLILLAVALATRVGPFARGLLLGLAWLRPQVAPVFAVAALTDRRSALGMGTSAALIAAASVALVGVQGASSYIAQLAGAVDWSVTGALGLERSVGWTGIALAIGAGPAGLVLALASLMIATVLVVRARRVPPGESRIAPGESGVPPGESDAQRLALAGPWSLLASPHALLHDAVLAYPAVAALATTRGLVAMWCASGVALAVLQLAGVPLLALWLLALGVAAARRPEEGPREERGARRAGTP